MSTEAGVRTIIAELLNLPFDRVRPDTELVDDLGAKHIDLIDMGLEIEGDFRVPVSWARFCTLRTVADVVAYVDERMAECGSFRLRAAS